MKQIICILFVILIISTEKTLSTETWKLNSSYQSTYFCDIDSYDSLNIMAVGHVSNDRARAYYSSDGGKLWKQIFPDSAIYKEPLNRIGGTVANSVSCKYEDLWLIGCDKNLIIRTTNKGTNWERVYINTHDSVIYQISMASKNIGYCRTWYSIFKTTNGGLNWDRVKLPKYTNPANFRRIVNFEVTDSNSIYINYNFEDASRNFKTNDSGLNWDEMIIDSNQVYQADFTFLENGVGWAMTQYFLPGLYKATKIWKTSDGGINWNLVYDSKDNGVAFDMQKILFIDNERGFIYQNKFLYRTNDGGYTWEQDEIKNVDINDTDFAVKKIIFVNDHKGFFINKKNKIYEYDYNSTDIIEQTFQKLSISPNPAGDFITIALKPSEGFEPSEGSAIQIYNTIGEKVMTVKQTFLSVQQINISALPKGMYFVNVGGETAKFVKL